MPYPDVMSPQIPDPVESSSRPTAPSERLAAAGLVLPDAVAPVAAYVPTVRSGAWVHVSGQVPFSEGRLLHAGKVGPDVSIEEAVACARQCALNGLAAVAKELDGLDGVTRVIKLLVFVASDPDFHGQAQVANGASELLEEVFGAVGRHARSAVGVAVLPLDSPVEVELVVEARD